MSSNTKKLIILVIIVMGLYAIGSCLFSGTLSLAVRGLKGRNGSNGTFTVSERFDEISVDAIVGNVTIKQSKDGKTSVERTGSGMLFFEVKVVGGKLKIVEKDKRPWFLRFGLINSGKSEITVYLPQSYYKKLEIEAAAGKVDIASGFSFRDVKIETAAGSVTLNSMNITDDLKLSTGAGKVTLKNVISADHMKIETAAGSVELDHCDAGEIEIETAAGSVKATLLSDKVFSVGTAVGTVRVPESVPGSGTCKIETAVGSVTVEIVGR